nr:hypothetical protein [Fluviibacterium sp. MJW13]
MNRHVGPQPIVDSSGDKAGLVQEPFGPFPRPQQGKGGQRKIRTKEQTLAMRQGQNLSPGLVRLQGMTHIDKPPTGGCAIAQPINRCGKILGKAVAKLQVVFKDQPGKSIAIKKTLGTGAM